MQSIHLVLCLANFFLILNTGLSHSLKRIPRDSHAGHAPWGYGKENGPETWGKTCRTGKKQSPININTGDVIETKYAQLEFSEKYAEPSRWKIVNNGHTIKAMLENETHDLFIGGAGLEGKYIFNQFHFHWGGAEHTIDGERKPLELHLVHYNSKYSDISEALDKKDGLAVIGILFNTQKKRDEGIHDIFKEIVESSAKDTKNPHKDIPPDPEHHSGHEIEDPIEFPAVELFPEEVEPWYRYEGSLTTPTCDESVIWTVLKNEIGIAEETLELFKNIPDDHGEILKINYRPTQDLHGRKVYFNVGHLNDIKEVENNQISNGSENLVFSKYLFYLSFYIVYLSCRKWL